MTHLSVDYQFIDMTPKRLIKIRLKKSVHVLFIVIKTKNFKTHSYKKETFISRVTFVYLSYFTATNQKKVNFV